MVLTTTVCLLLTQSGRKPSARLSRKGTTPTSPEWSFQFVFADATLYPGKPACSIVCCTNPEALACSINSLM